MSNDIDFKWLNHVWFERQCKLFMDQSVTSRFGELIHVCTYMQKAQTLVSNGYTTSHDIHSDTQMTGYVQDHDNALQAP